MQMQSTLREIRQFVVSLNNLVAYICTSVLCVLIAPFGTGEVFSLGKLTAYWFSSNAITLLIGEIIMIGALALSPRGSGFKFGALLFGGVVAASLITLAVYAVNAFFFSPGEERLSLWVLAQTTWPIGFLIAVTIGFLTTRLHKQKGASAPPANPSPFFKRLPHHLGQELLHLTTQDHYIEAVTTRGSHLILMRFADALDELTPEDGIQIHRSHWIAKNAMVGSKRQNGRLLLLTADGGEFPVSRTFMKPVKDYFQLD